MLPILILINAYHAKSNARHVAMIQHVVVVMKTLLLIVANVHLIVELADTGMEHNVLTALLHSPIVHPVSILPRVYPVLLGTNSKTINV